MEASFARARRPVLVQRIKWLCWMHILASMGVILVVMTTCGYTSWEAMTGTIADRSATVQVFCHAVLMMNVIFILKMRHSSLFKPFYLEACVVACMIFSMCVAVLGSPTRVAKLQGYSLAEVWPVVYDSDSGILLTIDVFVTATHLGLPIRWCVMMPLEFGAVLLYLAVLAFVGSEEPLVHILFNIIALVGLVCASTFGKRSMERDERRAWLSMIHERALRCEAEFQLSQVARVENSEECAQSQCASDPATEKSGAVFEPFFEKGMDRRTQLQRVAQMGDSERWRIPSGDVKLLPVEKLGEGGFGTVRRGIFAGMLVAVKCPRLDLGPMCVPDLCNELRVLRHLRHAHIVAAHGAVVLPEQQQIFLVLELIEGRSLTDFMRGEPNRLERYQVMLGVCKALLYMHTRVPHIVHGDLKGGNVMITASEAGVVAKVLDFGLSRVMSAHTRGLGGTLAWLAPEVLDQAPVHCSADVYSFGRILAYTATGIMPLRNMSYSAMVRALRAKRMPLPEWPESCAFAPVCRPLVQSCLSPRQECRPGILQIYEVLLGLAGSWPETEGCGYLQQVRQLAEHTATDLAIGMQAEPLSPGLLPDPGTLASLPEEELLPPTRFSDSAPPPPLTARTPDQARRKPVPFSNLRETSRAAMQASLMQTLMRWNTSELPASCCERHSWFKMGQKICCEGLTSDCSVGRLFRAQAALQCGSCGILGKAKGVCDLCGWDSETERASGMLSAVSPYQRRENVVSM